MLTHYRNPAAFDETMNQQARGILFWAIPIYCVACVWSFGNHNILEKPTFAALDAKVVSDTLKNSNLNNFFGPLVKFFDRATNAYGIPFALILAIFAAHVLLSFVFGNILGGLFKLIFGCCRVKLEEDKTKTDNWFDVRVQTEEMVDEFKLHDSLSKQNFYKDDVDGKLRNFVEDRLKVYNKNVILRNNLQNPGATSSSARFSTLSSYNFRMNPEYKRMFVDQDH